MPNKTVKKVEIGMDDGIVDLKGKSKDPSGFKVRKIEDDLAVLDREKGDYPKYDTSRFDQHMESLAEKLHEAVTKKPAMGEVSSEIRPLEPKELIKVKFAKFVQLVASRDFWQVMEKNKDEDIIMSSNLLTDLAGAVEDKSEKKTPVIFLVGLAIGVVVTYLLISR
jgi:hypothetical protein